MPRQTNKKEIDPCMLLTRSFSVSDFRAMPPEEGKTTREIDGHAAVFASKTAIGDWYFEVIERGAFDGCDFTDVLMCINHDIRKIPLARSRRNNSNSTMQISVDDIGLRVVAAVDVENNFEARQVVSSIDRGDMSGMSFYFCVAEDRWENLDTDMPTRHILKIAQVFELGPVNFPAYEQTDICARDKSALDNAKRALDNARSQELDNSKAVQILQIRNKIKGGL